MFRHSNVHHHQTTKKSTPCDIILSTFLPFEGLIRLNTLSKNYFFPSLMSDAHTLRYVYIFVYAVRIVRYCTLLFVNTPSLNI